MFPVDGVGVPTLNRLYVSKGSFWLAFRLLVMTEKQETVTVTATAGLYFRLKLRSPLSIPWPWSPTRRPVLLTRMLSVDVIHDSPLPSTLITCKRARVN